jgi:predicted ester cyclase
MTTQTKQIALDLFNRINAGDLPGAASLLAEDLVNHAAVPEAQGRKGFSMIQEKVRTAFPDVQYTLEDTIIDGDKAVLRMTVNGTQTGPLTFLRLQMPPSGKTVKFEQTHVLRVANGKVVEQWMQQDSIAMFRQLGIQLTVPS